MRTPHRNMPIRKANRFRQPTLFMTSFAFLCALLAVFPLAAVGSLSAPTLSLRWGSWGVGNGQFKAVQGVETDASDNVWVADADNNRIQKFNSKGEYLSKFGSYGAGNGQLEWPTDVAIDPSGNILVADQGNNRIQKFNSKGEYLSKFGSKGTGNGQFNFPTEMALDAAGNIWVVDAGNNRIQKFNSQGEFLLKFGSYGTGNGQFAGPQSIAVDAEGNMWVVDSQNQRIQKFNSKGEYLSKFGSKGTGDGQFIEPYGIAIDPQGTLWVTDYENSCRVQAFFPESGEFATKFGKCYGEEEMSTPIGIASDSQGNLFVGDNTEVTKWTRTPDATFTGTVTGVKRTEATLKGEVNPQGKATSYQFEYGTTTSFGKSAPVSPKSIGSGSSPVKVSEALAGLKYNTTYYYRVVATGEAGTVYGGTRHFTTLPGPGAEAKWRIGGETFAELGLSEESFNTSGSFEVQFPSFNTNFKCTEYGNGTLKSSGPTVVHMTLGCEPIGACELQPITMDVDGKFSSLYSNLALLESEGCNVISPEIELVNGTGSFEFGTEATKLNATALHTTKFGQNPVYIPGSSYWQLSGKNAGKTVGVW